MSRHLALLRGPADYRSAKPDSPRRHQVNVLLSPMEGALLNDLADAEGVNLPEALRRALVRMSWLTTCHPEALRELLARAPSEG